jgi:anti-sigma factor RsiW
MREDKTKTEEGAALWRRAREAGAPQVEDEAPEDLWLAAYLDGSLAEDEAARLEARLAGDPALLDELLTLRETLAAGPETAPAGVVVRAQALRPEQKETLRPEQKEALRPQWKAQPATAREEGSWFGHLLAGWLRPAVPAFAAVALVLACAGAFELGRYQGEQMDATQSAEVADSDVPVDLLLEDLI